MNLAVPMGSVRQKNVVKFSAVGIAGNKGYYICRTGLKVGTINADNTLAKHPIPNC
jgi:hypothetical protein